MPAEPDPMSRPGVKCCGVSEGKPKPAYRKNLPGTAPGTRDGKTIPGPVGSAAHLLPEQAQVDRVSHGLVPGVVRVVVVPAVVGRQDALRVAGIAHRRVEVDHPVV